MKFLCKLHIVIFLFINIISKSSYAVEDKIFLCEIEEVLNIPEYYDGITADKIKFKCNHQLMGKEKIKLRMFWNNKSYGDFDFQIHDQVSYEKDHPLTCIGENENYLKEGKVNIDIFSHNDRNRIMVKGIPSYDYGLQLFWIQKDTSDVEVGSMPKVSIGYGQCEMY